MQRLRGAHEVRFGGSSLGRAGSAGRGRASPMRDRDQDAPASLRRPAQPQPPSPPRRGSALAAKAAHGAGALSSRAGSVSGQGSARGSRRADEPEAPPEPDDPATARSPPLTPGSQRVPIFGVEDAARGVRSPETEDDGQDRWENPSFAARPMAMRHAGGYAQERSKVRGEYAAPRSAESPQERERSNSRAEYAPPQQTEYAQAMGRSVAHHTIARMHDEMRDVEGWLLMLERENAAIRAKLLAGRRGVLQRYFASDGLLRTQAAFGNWRCWAERVRREREAEGHTQQETREGIHYEQRVQDLEEEGLVLRTQLQQMRKDNQAQIQATCAARQAALGRADQLEVPAQQKGPTGSIPARVHHARVHRTRARAHARVIGPRRMRSVASLVQSHGRPAPPRAGNASDTIDFLRPCTPHRLRTQHRLRTPHRLRLAAWRVDGGLAACPSPQALIAQMGQVAGRVTELAERGTAQISVGARPATSDPAWTDGDAIDLTKEVLHQLLRDVDPSHCPRAAAAADSPGAWAFPAGSFQAPRGSQAQAQARGSPQGRGSQAESAGARSPPRGSVEAWTRESTLSFAVAGKPVTVNPPRPEATPPRPDATPPRRTTTMGTPSAVSRGIPSVQTTTAPRLVALASGPPTPVVVCPPSPPKVMRGAASPMYSLQPGMPQANVLARGGSSATSLGFYPRPPTHSWSSLGARSEPPPGLAPQRARRPRESASLSSVRPG